MLLSPHLYPHDAAPAAARRGWWRPTVFAQRWPFLSLFLVIVFSNGSGSLFNTAYNNYLTVQYLDEGQREAFWKQVVPLYNVLAYPLCLGYVLYLLLPLARC